MKKKEKFNFKQKKNNIINSITDVEQFLQKSTKISKYLKFIKAIKKQT